MDKFVPLELQEYANQVINVGGNDFTVKDLTYISQEDIFSTSCVVPGSTGLVAANSTVRMWQTQIGQSGQGFTQPLTKSDTNNTWGVRFGGNEMLLVPSFAFDFYVVTSAANSAPLAQRLTDLDIRNLGLSFNWSLQIGSGNERVQGMLLQYPFGSGAYIGAAIGDSASGQSPTVFAAQNGGPNVPARRRSTLTVIPPSIDLNITLSTGVGIQLVDTPESWDGTKAIAIRGNMRAFRFTVPVG